MSDCGISLSYSLFAMSMHSGYFFNVLLPADFLHNKLNQKIFQEPYQSIKQFGYRSGPTFYGYKLFAKVTSRRPKLLLARAMYSIDLLLTVALVVLQQDQPLDLA